MPRSIRSIPLVAVFLAALMSAALGAALSLTVLRAEAISDMATGEPVVSIIFDATSTEAFAAFTRDHVGRTTVVRIDGEEIMRPIIREPIVGGEVRISGGMTMEDAKKLAARLTSGDAVIEVELVEE
jgi:preprotein translocase subunit SecD